MIATNTTRFLVTNTTRLRSALRRVDPYTALSLALIALITLGGLARSSLQPAPAPAPIIIVATSALASGEHGSVQRSGRAPAALRVLPTAVVRAAAPAPTVEPVQLEQPVGVQVQVQSVPAPTAWVADPPITYSAAGSTTQIEVPAGAPRYCDGFGDWRDYDAMFASSPACHGGQP